MDSFAAAADRGRVALLVTGGAGFIANTLISRLLARGEHIIAVDNLSRGSLDFLRPFLEEGQTTFIEADLSDLASTQAAFRAATRKSKVSEVWHLAANSDIPAGTRDPDIDYRDTFLTTYNTLKVMEHESILDLFFASSSSVYGDHGDVALSETTGPLLPLSNYGAMKLASEAAISAASERFLNRALMFRFPNVVGLPATHGVILDFAVRLSTDPSVLQVLGDGNQQKAYLHVLDLVEAMLFIRARCNNKVDVFNIGPEDEGIMVNEIAQEVVRAMAPRAEIRFEVGKKAWVGDVPRFRYSVQKLKELGWETSNSSRDAVRKAVSEIRDARLSMTNPH